MNAPYCAAMAKNTLNAPHFHSERRAREFLEKLRWNGHPVCPHCDAVSSPYATKRMGRYRCSSKACRKDFSVTTKTMMEFSHINLHIWLQAFYYMAFSKKPMSSSQLHRTLKISYKTAWFLAQRIRKAMCADEVAKGEQLWSKNSS